MKSLEKGNLRQLGLGISIVLLCIGVLSCERREREQGGRAPELGSPQFKVSEHVSALTRVSNVEEVAPRIAGAGPDGQALFATNCVACHQTTGQGVPGAFPPLDGSKYVTGDNVERLASIILYGLTGPMTVKGVQYNNVMLPQGHLKDEELAAIASYVRSSWSNKASPIEAAVFQKMRQKHGQRAQFKIEELGVEPDA